MANNLRRRVLGLKMSTIKPPLQLAFLLFFLLVLCLMRNSQAYPYLAPENYLVVDDPRAAVSADFDGDGFTDLAVANYRTNQISVLINNGDSTYKTAVNYDSIGVGPRALVARDFNGTTGIDLAVVNYVSNSVDILFNDGTNIFNGISGFTNGGSYAGFYGPASIAADNFDGATGIDLVVTNSYKNDVIAPNDSFNVLLNNGAGIFSGPVNYPTPGGDMPLRVLSADLDGDMIKDVVIANFVTENFIVYEGNGDGTFNTALPLDQEFTGYGATDIALGYFDNNASMDIAVINFKWQDQDSVVKTYLNNGVANFIYDADYTVGSSAGSIVAGDFTNDSKTDLAVSNYMENSIFILKGNGSGAFSLELNTIATPAGPIQIIATDVDNDTRLDLVSVNKGENNPLTGSPQADSGNSISVFRSGVIITQSDNNTMITEDGLGLPSDTYTVVLASQPSANVYITVAHDGLVSLSTDPSGILTFTSADWFTPQTVTIYPVNDGSVQGEHISTITHIASSTDASFNSPNGIVIPNVNVKIIDDDKSDITIYEPGNGTEVKEHGATDSFTVVLNKQPASNVTVSLAASSQLSLSAYSLLFTPADYSTPQAVTVTAVADIYIEGTQTELIALTASSPDLSYNPITKNVLVNVIDQNMIRSYPVCPGRTLDLDNDSTISSNDRYQSILISKGRRENDFCTEFNGDGYLGNPDFTSIEYYLKNNETLSPSAYDIYVVEIDSANQDLPDGTTDISEDGIVDDYVIYLNYKPKNNVIIYTDPYQDPITNRTQVSTNKSTLTFTGLDYFVPQKVRITAIDDSYMEASPHDGIVKHTAVSADNNYNGKVIDDITANITDNDVAGVIITETGGSTAVSEDPGALDHTDTINIKLTSFPDSDVIINFSTPDLQTSVSPPSFTFTSGNGKTDQTLTITAFNDAIYEGSPHSGEVRAEIDPSSDPSFTGTTPINVTINENDPQPTLTINNRSRTEVDFDTDDYPFVATLSAASGVETRVLYATADGTATLADNDYVSSTDWLFFAPGETTKNFTVQSIGDLYVEPNEAFSVNLSDAVNASILDDQGVATIINDDIAGFTIAPAPAIPITEGLTNSLAWTVVLTAQPRPGNNVVIGITRADPALAVDTASLTFTNANWNVAQNISITAPEDANAITETGVVVTFTVNDGLSEDAWDGLTNTRLVDVTDNDTAGFTVSALSNDTTEAGATATFTVVLNTQPMDDVTIGISSDVITEGTVLPVSLLFTSGNWNTPQMVTITGIDDYVDDGDIAYNIITAPDTITADLGYKNMNPADVAVTNIDNDTAGVTIKVLDNLTSESGDTGSFTIVLNSEPTASVTIPLSSSNTLIGTIPVANAVFTTGDWNALQTITVTGVDDVIPVSSGPVAYNINTGDPSSADLIYGAFGAGDVADIAMLNQNNDNPGIVVTMIGAVSQTTEAGGTLIYQFTLLSQPTANVIIPLSVSDATEGSLGVANIEITRASWNTPAANQVTVTGADDSIMDGNILYTLVTGDPTSGDGVYNALTASATADPTITNLDDDLAGFTVSGILGNTNEDAGTATFTVVLTSEPTADVIIDLSSSDATEGTVLPASLTFTSSNWNDPKLATVTGIDDFVDDGDIAYSIITALASSLDTNYNNQDPANVAVTNIDNDTAGFTVNVIDNLTSESGDTGSFSIVLNSKPTADVVVLLSSDNTSVGTIIPVANVVFNTGDWNIPQTITITGVNDIPAVSSGPVAYNIMTGDPSSADPIYNAFGAGDVADIAMLNQNNDNPGIVVTMVGASSQTTEAGGTLVFQFTLLSQPTADVTIPLLVPDATEGTLDVALIVITQTNWNTPADNQVTITGVDDSIMDGNILYTLVTGNPTSVDGVYDALLDTDIADPTITNLDDDIAGFTVSAISGNTTEAAGTATFMVVLTSEPTADVTIDLSSSDMTEGIVSPASLTFTSSDWATSQMVTVTGVNDFIDDGDVIYSINTALASSTDTNYNLDPADVSVTNTDDDTAGITVTPTFGLITTEAGGTAIFTVVLITQPTHAVTIDISSFDTTEGTVLPLSLTFTPGNWSMTQTVTVTGVNDVAVDGNVAYTIITAAAVSADTDYNGIDPGNVLVINNDNDTSSSGGPSGPGTPAPVPITILLPPGIFVGELVKRADMTTVYFVDDDLKRHAFPSQETYFSWFENFVPVRTISAETMAAITLGSNVTVSPGTYLIKIQSISKVFAVEPGGVLRWVQNEDIAVKLWGNKWNERVIDISPAFFVNYQEGIPITEYKHPTGSLVQWAIDTKVYYVENSTRRYVSNSAFINNKYQNRFVYRQLTPDFFYINAIEYPALDISAIMILK